MPFSPAWLISASVAFAAGILRGYTGFGFAITMALGLLWLLPPIQVVTTVLLLDLLGALGLVANAWRRADHAVLKRLLPTMLLASALGIASMTVLPTTAARLVVTAICLIGAVATLLQRPPAVELASALDRARDLRWAWPAGGASGLAMSLSSAGGPPLMVYLMRTRLTPEAARATAILFFIAASSVSLLGYISADQMRADTLWLALTLSPLAVIGSALGHWLFERFPPVSFRTVVAPLLVLMASWMLIREVRTQFFG